MLLSPADQPPPNEKTWAYELKWDGIWRRLEAASPRVPPPGKISPRCFNLLR
jgi:hypothetical protein